MIRRLFYLLLLLFGIGFQIMAQEKATIYGKISDTISKPIELVNVFILGTTQGTKSDKNGNFELTVPANQELTIAYSFIGLQQVNHKVTLKPGERKEMNQIMLSTTTTIKTFSVYAKDERAVITRIDIKQAEFIPTTSGNAIEELIKDFEAKIDLFFDYVRSDDSGKRLIAKMQDDGLAFDSEEIYDDFAKLYRKFIRRNKDLSEFFIKETQDIVNQLCDDFERTLKVRYIENEVIRQAAEK